MLMLMLNQASHGVINTTVSDNEVTCSKPVAFEHYYHDQGSAAIAACLMDHGHAV
jgi:hypothetical protein